MTMRSTRCCASLSFCLTQCRSSCALAHSCWIASSSFDLPGLEAAHDLLELGERILETHRRDVGGY